MKLDPMLMQGLLIALTALLTAAAGYLGAKTRQIIKKLDKVDQAVNDQPRGKPTIAQQTREIHAGMENIVPKMVDHDRRIKANKRAIQGIAKHVSFAIPDSDFRDVVPKRDGVSDVDSQ